MTSILPFSTEPLDSAAWEGRHQLLKSFPKNTFLGNLAKRVGGWDPKNPEESAFLTQSTLRKAADLIQRAMPLLTLEERRKIPSFQRAPTQWGLRSLQVMGEAIAEKRAQNLLRFLEFYAETFKDTKVQRFLESLPSDLTVREVAQRCRTYIKEHGGEIYFSVWSFDVSNQPLHPPEVKYFWLYRGKGSSSSREYTLFQAAQRGNEETLEAMIPLIHTDNDCPAPIHGAIRESFLNGHHHLTRGLIDRYKGTYLYLHHSRTATLNDPMLGLIELIQKTRQVSQRMTESAISTASTIEDPATYQQVRQVLLKAHKSAIQRAGRGF
ncbi:MAG: hypothetical protein KGJ02_03940 [Verrucomicrobiota bacterium]|nr:hypothetical protein [Verrucomicrobiota bacterium]